MFIPALIFVFSVAATVKFAIYSWRARMLRFVASVEQVEDAANLLISNSFSDILAYQELCPSLEADSTPKLGLVRLYYTAMEMVGSGWAKAEMALCARYAGAVMAQRMARNQLLAAEVRSF